MRTNREYCRECNKAVNACICNFIETVENITPITILRHSSEKGKEKATADLINRSLTNCKIIDGEKFESSEVLKEGYENVLVYPKEDSSLLDEEFTQINKNIHFIFIDGTWKKAFKIYQLNNFLHRLQTVHLALKKDSPYSDIRKQIKNGLSTYEAVYESLSICEPEIRSSNLVKNFHSFLSHLKSFRI